MGWESFGLVGFDLGSLLQGQTRITKVKSAYNLLIIFWGFMLHYINVQHLDQLLVSIMTHQTICNF